MKTFSIYVKVSAVGFAWFFSASVASSAVILFEDSFETPPETVGSAPTQWSLSGAGVTVVNTVASEGTNSLSVRSGVGRTLTQTTAANINNAAGLVISWDWKQNSSFESGDGLVLFAVDFGNGFVDILTDMGEASGTVSTYTGSKITLDNTAGTAATDFTSYSVAIDSSYYVGATTFSLRFQTYSGADPETSNFDNILVTAVPEPSSILLLGLGCCGLALRRRR